MLVVCFVGCRLFVELLVPRITGPVVPGGYRPTPLPPIPFDSVAVVRCIVCC